MKKLFALLLCLMMVLPMASLAEEKVDITLWTYPIGNWGKEEAVKTLTDAFKEDTGITVKVEYLAYADHHRQFQRRVSQHQRDGSVP